MGEAKVGPVDSLEARHVEAMETLARNATTGEALTGAASDGYALLAFALAMLAMAGLGCSLCVAATSCCLARAERALRESVRGNGEGWGEGEKGTGKIEGIGRREQGRLGG